VIGRRKALILASPREEGRAFNFRAVPGQLFNCVALKVDNPYIASKRCRNSKSYSISRLRRCVLLRLAKFAFPTFTLFVSRSLLQEKAVTTIKKVTKGMAQVAVTHKTACDIVC
jgi:hypothetical protein